jgi:hypothetical protein
MRLNGAVRAALVGLVVLTLVWACHRIVLTSLGAILVVDESVGRSDVVVLAADAFEDGAPDAAAFVLRGLAPRVAVFTVAGSKDYDPTDETVRYFRSVGVPVVQLSTPVRGTTDSLPAFVDWAREHDVHTAIVVTTADHSRRVRSVLDRANARDHGVVATIHVARDSAFRVDDWWAHPRTLIDGVKELTKLAVYEAIQPAR